MTFTVPQSYRELPRWWRPAPLDAAWLEGLPHRVDQRVRDWSLALDADVPRHGSNALVLPVSRDGRALVLRLAPPTDDVAAEVAALRHWAGRGAVELVE